MTIHSKCIPLKQWNLTPRWDSWARTYSFFDSRHWIMLPEVRSKQNNKSFGALRRKSKAHFLAVKRAEKTKDKTENKKSDPAPIEVSGSFVIDLNIGRVWLCRVECNYSQGKRSVALVPKFFKYNYSKNSFEQSLPFCHTSVQQLKKGTKLKYFNRHYTIHIN